MVSTALFPLRSPLLSSPSEETYRQASALEHNASSPRSSEETCRHAPASEYDGSDHFHSDPALAIEDSSVFEDDPLSPSDSNMKSPDDPETNQPQPSLNASENSFSSEGCGGQPKLLGLLALYDVAYILASVNYPLLLLAWQSMPLGSSSGMAIVSFTCGVIPLVFSQVKTLEKLFWGRRDVYTETQIFFQTAMLMFGTVFGILALLGYLWWLGTDHQSGQSRLGREVFNATA